MTTPTALPWHHPAMLLATLGGSGLIPLAPGTWGSAVAVALAWAGVALGDAAGIGGGPVLAVAIPVVFIFGLWACGVVQDREQTHDASKIVVDEAIGQWIALLGVIGAERADQPLWWLAAFALFRLFDIAKPWPVSWADRQVQGALGVMLDDILAGVYAMIVIAVADAALAGRIF